MTNKKQKIFKVISVVLSVALSIALALMLCFIVSGCNNKEENLSLDEFKAETTVEFIKLPSPPKYKLLKSEKDIEKLNEYIEDYEKTEIESTDINGWSVLLKYSNEPAPLTVPDSDIFCVKVIV